MSYHLNESWVYCFWMCRRQKNHVPIASLLVIFV